VKNSKEHVFARKVQAFLNDPSPDQERISQLLEELVNTGKNKKAGKPSKKQLLELCQCIVCAYLDKVTFFGKAPEKIQALGKDLRKLKENKFDTRSILKRWNPEEVSLHVPAVPV
jgi:thymidylate synthase